ncbi:MAG: M18 family aminopeptidase [Actinomycetia bacterium]|nr:M18 family aminopeptidase [Actinomycetes bacterium]MCP4087229.1 M18 family aminopeptidase [Actinomycetes bacterium]
MSDSPAPPPPSEPELVLARDLISYIDGSPSPFHAVASSVERLAGAGFSEVNEADDWPPGTGGFFLRAGGTLIAWVVPDRFAAGSGFRLAGAHTDSPNLRVRPRPDTDSVGWRQLGVEIYGGVLVNSWLDRDLGLSGRVVVRAGSGSETVLFRDDRALLRVPQLAIHLDREITEKGLKLDRQQHLSPIWGLGTSSEGDFRAWLARELDQGADDVLAWDLMAHTVEPSALAGLDDAFVSAPRIDNQLSCHALTQALVEGDPALNTAVPIICLYDHEEVGSTSATGAAGRLLARVMERIVRARATVDADDAWLRSLAASACLSVDGAHATHPNYAGKHEPNHHIAINGGPVVKVNNNQRYASEAETIAGFLLAAERVGIEVQHYGHPNDLPCGSTIGPITAAQLGIPTVDVGAPQLAMHSARELAGTADPARLVAVVTSWLAG